MKKFIILLSSIVLFIILSIGYLTIKVPSDKEILKTKELSIPLGETKKIEINTQAEYEIKDNTYATIDMSGNVKGIKKGSTTIYVKTKNKEYFIPIEITDPVLDINIFDQNIEIVKGNTQELNLILKENIKIKSYEYDQDIIEVNNQTIKGINVGKTNLRIYTNNNTYIDINISVSDITININKVKTELFINEETELKINTNSNNEEKIIWTSANENIATINNGIVKGISVGETTITAKAYGKEVSCLIKVINKVEKIKSLKLNKTFLNIQLGETFDVVAYTEPNIPSNLIKYEILDSSVVILENNKIIPKRNGKTLLKASIYDKEYYMTIYVGNINKTFTNYQKDKIINIFDEVALNEEYTSRVSSKQIQKWNSPVYYYYKNASNEDIEQIKKITNLLNSIPEFPGIFETSLEKANLIIDFTSYEILHSKTKIGGVEGYSENTFASDNIITKSNIMINQNLNQNIKNSVIAEEMLHSIGLKNDTKTCSNSVLYEYGSRVEYPTDIDILLINILYDETITYGMDNNTVKNKIISILK